MSLGPFDLTGGPFLTLYIVLFAATVIAGFIIPRRMRPPGRMQRVTDVDQLAYLSGGGARFSDAVVARLLAARALIMTGKDSFSVVSREPAVSLAERSVVALLPPIRWREIDRVLKPYAEPLQRKMIAAGLLMDDAERGSIRFSVTLPYVMLFTFGATKWIIGDARDRPIGYLSALLVVTAIVAVIRWLSIDPRTQAAHDAVADATHQAERLKIAPTNPEIGLAVALFGTTVLVGSGWADFHRLRGADGGSGGGSDGDGGSGCGGGCGGCGG